MMIAGTLFTCTMEQKKETKRQMKKNARENENRITINIKTIQGKKRKLRKRRKENCHIPI
tara:strand:+ start:575 stop:754 length:180 start_codon:yes stop_codon:yes gene_type:complete